jgi:splicing factor U2AF subunit
MLEVDELRDDEEFADILEDMREECGKFGEVAEIVIPRPDAEGREAPAGLGKVFVLYADVAGAVAARDALHGRKFGGKTVVADFLDPEAFAKRDF